MTGWDERFRTGAYPTDPDPSPVLARYVDGFPDGRALDVATGTGRNAVFLAQRGHRVEAIDRSRVGLEVARATAADRGVVDRTDWLVADAAEFRFPRDRYAAVAIGSYRPLDRLPDIEDALIEGGYLFVEHHLRSTEPVDAGPSGDRYRFAANESLHAGLDMTVPHYDETTRTRDGRRRATAGLVARNSTGRRQSCPSPDGGRAAGPTGKRAGRPTRPPAVPVSTPCRTPARGPR